MMIAEKAKVRVEGNEKPLLRAADREAQVESKRLGGLVLARQLGESIMIGDSVMVEVLSLKTNTVRLRIVAPRSVSVHRREVYDAIRLSPQATPSVPANVDASPVGAPSKGSDGGLVLTRRAGQTIMIGDEVAIDVVEARPGTVRLRVIAPRSISVHRREIYDAIQNGESRELPGDPGSNR